VVDGRSVWKAWAAALAWLALIGIESTSALSSENTQRFLYPVLHFLFNLDPFRFVVWHFYLRKMGHVLGYGTLSFLLFRAWRASLPGAGKARWSIVWARTALFMTVLVASADEWHQSFIPTRTGTVRDVALDSAAALAAQILLFLWLRGGQVARSLVTPDHPAIPSPDAKHIARPRFPVRD
jgi:VanZ family protein